MRLFSKKIYFSDKNDKVLVTKLFGVTSIVVSGCIQSGGYIRAMWRDTFTRIQSNAHVNSILILGLGGGDAVSVLHKKYPQASITVIEWDKVMIDIGQEHKLIPFTPNITILEEDAFQILPRLQSMFDIIVVDLFTGSTPPQEITSVAILYCLSGLLENNGYIFVNIYKHIEYLGSYKKVFATTMIWNYKYNTLGVFRKQKQGTV